MHRICAFGAQGDPPLARAGKIAAGVELFYLEIVRQPMKRKELALAWRLQPKSQWGRRAEDPFRGLRAGPVRYSPLFLFPLQLSAGGFPQAFFPYIEKNTN
jgi:hypothetical protein